jgi:hypothetical protein
MHKTETGQLVFDSDWEVAEYVTERFRRAEAYDSIVVKNQDYHKYAKDYLMPDAWGRNVYHSVIEDAIEMRKVFEPKPHAFDSDNICFKCGQEKANVGSYCKNG